MCALTTLSFYDAQRVTFFSQHLFYFLLFYVCNFSVTKGISLSMHSAAIINNQLFRPINKSLECTDKADWLG